MRTRLKLDFWLTLLAFAFPIAAQAMQENLPDVEGPANGTIEIEYPVAVWVPYRERRPTWGIVAGAKYENFTPTAYRSEVDGASYSSMFGSKSLAMIGPELGAKFNFGFGSLVATGSYQQATLTGTAQDQTLGAVNITMNLTKIAGHAGLFLDTLWPEPYVVPYGMIDYMSLSYEEKDNVSTDDTRSGTADGIIGFTGGVLVQLNWLDPSASFDSLDNVGVNNTFLNLFLTKVDGSKFGNDLDWGVGLLLEF